MNRLYLNMARDVYWSSLLQNTFAISVNWFCLVLLFFVNFSFGQTVVANDCLAPTIITQPVIPATTCSGTGTQTLSVVATGTGLTYSWRKNGVVVSNGGVINGQGTTTLTLTNPVVTDAGSYNVVVSGSCSPAVTSNAVTVSVNSISVAPTGITGTTTICNGSSITLTLSGGSKGTVATAQWFSGSCGGTAVGTGDNITVSPTSTTTYYVRYSGVCSTTACASTTVTVTPATVAGTLTSPKTNVCSGANYTNLNLSGYTGSILRWESSIDNFTTVNSISNTNSDYGASNLTADTSYRVVVQNGSCNVLYSNVVKIAVSGAMPAPGGISLNGGTTYPVSGGGTNYCASTSATFSIASVPNATNYIWVIPNGWSVISGQGTTTLTVVTGNTSQSANIEVYANNSGCGDTNRSYLWLQLTNTPNAPTGSSSQSFCSASFPTVANLAATGTGIKWYATYSGGSALATTTALVNGAHYYASQTINGCGESASRLDVTATLNTNLSAVSVTPNGAQIICIGSSGSALTSSPTNGGVIVSRQWGKRSVSGGTITPISGETTANYTPTGAGLTAGTWYVVCTSTPTCGSPMTSNEVMITVNDRPVAPTVGTTTQPSCTTPTGSVFLSGLPASGTLFQTGTAATNYPITGTTMTISGLAAGTYNFSASNGSCTSLATANVVFNPLATNKWDGNAWSNGTPSASQILVFNGNYPPSPNPNVDITGCSCTISAGANVTIKLGRSLSLTNEVVVLGTLTFENSASLIQKNGEAVNTGSIIYKRTTPSLIETDYTYWSSPVANQTLDISPDYAYGTFYSYDSSVDNWADVNISTTMSIGKGYIIRGQRSDNDAYNITATFKGVPNNGTKTLSINPTNSAVLLGNPFPSALDAEAFLDYNAAVLDGTIYFWTHKTAIQAASNIPGKAGSGVFAYTSDDYASYNAVGGVSVGNGTASPSGSVVPSGKIGAGQGFFGTIKAAGTITFNNNMRLNSDGSLMDNIQFFSAKPTKEKHRIWLNLSNTEGAFKQVLIGYVTDATNNYERRFDGQSFDANEYVDFYSISQDKNLVIQGRALPFDENDEVPLGFKTVITGEFTINIDQTDGLLANQPVFLEDKLTNTIVDLKSGNYTFSTTEGTFDDRFVLRYAGKTLGTTDTEMLKNSIVVSVKDKQININSFAENMEKVVVYDESGKEVYQREKLNTNELVISNLVSSHQVLIVKTSLQNGEIVSKKVIY
ncbi:hypothetical protein SAMN05443549_106116 [Flavobacterium fluvii]|uniref:Ig-like domain-containing protein n=1 Tax=Flavobacterium fluvii TaxID=468056 RepID=A0A1M5MC87_9FLAO|nr:T9SS sorting signal type C domain-containing protein [Flavobacterium fluvii]SHG74920.1 hypothetical protein SAMN05443549_106116 [Flavobacterium fluvii]